MSAVPALKNSHDIPSRSLLHIFFLNRLHLKVRLCGIQSYISGLASNHYWARDTWPPISKIPPFLKNCPKFQIAIIQTAQTQYGGYVRLSDWLKFLIFGQYNSMSAAILLESWSKYFLYLRLRVLLLAIGYFATASQLFASTYYETMLLFGCGA